MPPPHLCYHPTAAERLVDRSFPARAVSPARARRAGRWPAEPPAYPADRCRRFTPFGVLPLPPGAIGIPDKAGRTEGDKRNYYAVKGQLP